MGMLGCFDQKKSPLIIEEVSHSPEHARATKDSVMVEFVIIGAKSGVDSLSRASRVLSFAVHSMYLRCMGAGLGPFICNSGYLRCCIN